MAVSGLTLRQFWPSGLGTHEAADPSPDQRHTLAYLQGPFAGSIFRKTSSLNVRIL
jgi:hypothetical protein